MTLTPALALILLRKSQIERRQSPLVGFLQRGYTLSVVAHHRPAPGGVRRVRRGHPRRPDAGARCSGQSLFPAFKERDFLIHWVTQPGTSAAEMQRTTIAVSKELRAIPGVRNFGAHIGQAFLGEEVAGVNLGENWVSTDPRVDYEDDAGRDRGGQRQLPGPVPGDPDLSRRAHRGGHLRRQGAHRRPGLRRDLQCCAPRPRRSTRSWPASTASETSTSTSRPTCRSSQVEVDLPRRRGTA